MIRILRLIQEALRHTQAEVLEKAEHATNVAGENLKHQFYQPTNSFDAFVEDARHEVSSFFEDCRHDAVSICEDIRHDVTVIGINTLY